MLETEHHVAVVALGDPLMADDGLGVHALRRLGDAGLPARVLLIEGGCDAHRALSDARGCRRLVLLDSVTCGAEPGSIHCLPLAELLERGARMSTHGVNMLRLLEYERLLGNDFEEVHVLGMEPATLHFSDALSECCSRRLDEFVHTVRETLNRFSM